MPETACDIYTREISYSIPGDIPARYLAKGTPLFTAYGCVLLERQTAKSYVYTAVNISDGKSETLSRRTMPLAESGHSAMAAKIQALPIAGAARLGIDAIPGKSYSNTELHKTLTNLFTDIFPGYGFTLRKNQVELAEHILQTICRRNISLAESEVGTGKTLAYLTAAVLAKRGRTNDFWLRDKYPSQSYAESAWQPIVVATSSIALQQAIVSDYIPALSDILLENGIIRTPLTSVIRKGKEHYLCEKRLRNLYNDADERTKALLEALLPMGASCDLADSEGLTAFMKRKICVAGQCGENCRHIASCRYLRHMARAGDSHVDFQITNHNYFLADTLHRASGKRPLLPHYQMAIIDEAHKFLGAARQMYGVELAADEIPTLAEYVHSFTEGKSADGVNIHRLAKKLEEQGNRLFRRLRESLPTAADDETERYPAVMDADVTRHLNRIVRIADDLVAVLPGLHVQARHRERRAQTVWALRNLSERATNLQAHGDMVCWLEIPDNTESDMILKAIPRDLDARLHRDIWSKGLPVILTSGTLSSGGDFTRTKQSLGLARMSPSLSSEVSMASPFDYKNNALLYFSDRVPFPDNSDKAYISAVADEVERLILAGHGHAAVLFTSYNVMGQVYSLLSQRDLPFPMFRMGRRDTTALERFRQSGNGVLFASGSLWEGIDIPGDALSMLIIVKLPFAVPDPIGDYEKTLCDSMEEYKNTVLVPDMLVKLKQGFGRLIRTEGDSGVCAILDSRARKGAAYHERVLTALPECRMSRGIGEIPQFMADKKPPAYFE
ncbi:ATP-dependent DNA helicase [Tyzzerella sp. OttesenSCG-928-J15]|nr:ATP-dependent DNA helicase [Tyzzerella sp. OttesenSCG-928-J15]